MRYSKKAEELIGIYGSTKNIARLTRELKSLEKAKRDMEKANKNITKILKIKKKR